MDARDTPAHDSVHNLHSAAKTPDDGRSERLVSIARDDAFYVLQDSCRRAVLRFLLTEETDGPTPLSTLAAFVAAIEYDESSARAVGEIQERVRISLHHSHLPLLSEHGVVTYDPETETVEANPLVAAFEPFLSDGLGANDEFVVDTVQVDRHGYQNAAQY